MSREYNHKRLIQEARKSMRRAIAPYSKFKVGAAIATGEGKIYTGCNIENPSLMLSICAEKVALLKALSEGEKHFKAMVIVSSSKKYCYPCGSCRQILWEFAKDIEIYLTCDDPDISHDLKNIKKFSLSEFLPYPFIR
ncbi:MAG: cytidine deaminase [Nitrospirota bacterium]